MNNPHQNARTTPLGRAEMVRRIVEQGQPVTVHHVLGRDVLGGRADGGGAVEELAASRQARRIHRHAQLHAHEIDLGQVHGQGSDKYDNVRLGLTVREATNPMLYRLLITPVQQLSVQLSMPFSGTTQVNLSH